MTARTRSILSELLARVFDVRHDDADTAAVLGYADDLEAEVERLTKALREVEKGQGPYNRDPLEHASNVIEHMQSVAREALAKSSRRVMTPRTRYWLRTKPRALLAWHGCTE